MKRLIPSVVCSTALFCGIVDAQVPSVMTYQGRVQVVGTNFTGPGQFKFALVNAGTNTSRQATALATVTSGFITSIAVTDGGAGYSTPPGVIITDATGSGAMATAQVAGGAVTGITVQNAGSGYSSPVVTLGPPGPTMVYVSYWSNDGSSSAGSEPATAVTVPVQQGLFTVFLGDTGLTNMQPVPSSVFMEPDVRLRIWFSDGQSGFALLAPDQRLGAVGYANLAAQVSAAAIGSAALADGSVTAGKIASNAVTSAQIQDGTLVAADLSPALLNGTFWNLAGNTGTAPGANFLGTTDDQPLELHVSGRRALRLEPTLDDANHSNVVNVLSGSPVNLVPAGTYGATVSGGGAGYYADSAGPGTNIVAADFGTVGGGFQNVILGSTLYSTISGGVKNTIQGGAEYATVAGGQSDTINASRGAIGGGSDNTIDVGSDWGTIAGGQLNVESAALYAFIGGGYANTANGLYGVIAGGRSNFIEPGAGYSDIGGGSGNYISGGTTSGYESIGGGTGNIIQSNSLFCTIGGGSINLIEPNVGSGTIAGGRSNDIRPNASAGTIGGGYANTVYGQGGTVPGGEMNTATGQYSLAAGLNANAAHPGAFVWADSTGTAFSSQRNDQFRVRANGGVRLDLNYNTNWVEFYYKVVGVAPFQVVKVIDTGVGAYLSGGGSWVNNSDRERKENFQAIEPQVLLDKVAALPITRWNYKSEGAAVQHIGPMAQDFHAAFGLNADDKHIATVDEEGVALAALQALNAKVEAQARQLQAKQHEIAELKQDLAELRASVARLAARSVESNGF